MPETNGASPGPSSCRTEGQAVLGNERDAGRLIAAPALHVLSALSWFKLDAPPPDPERMAQGKRRLQQMAERKRARRLSIAAVSAVPAAS